MKAKWKWIIFLDILAVILALGIVVYAQPKGAIRFLQGLSGERMLYLHDSDRHIALTIDDGPDPNTTGRILDVLLEHEAKATFFLIGENIAGNEAIVRRMLAEGHEIGNHGWQDRMSLLLVFSG